MKAEVRDAFAGLESYQNTILTDALRSRKQFASRAGKQKQETLGAGVRKKIADV